jgi:hypothetical protein
MRFIPSHSGSSRAAVAGLLFGAACAFLFAACGRESAREAGLEWQGNPMRITQRVENPTREQLKAEGFRMGASPKRLLRAGSDGIDTLRLLDFGDETAAYAAFQELAAHPEDFSAGFAVGTDQVFFRRGRWVGAVEAWAWKGMAELEEGLSVPGTVAGTAGTLPRAFGSLLHQGRIEGSERILTREFLGLPLSERVFAARMECQGDTAWIYASPSLARAFGLRLARERNARVDSSGRDLRISLRSAGFSPLEARFSGGGMAAVEGCFDESLTNFWLKMQVRGLKSLN